MLFSAQSLHKSTQYTTFALFNAQHKSNGTLFGAINISQSFDISDSNNGSSDRALKSCTSLADMYPLTHTITSHNRDSFNNITSSQFHSGFSDNLCHIDFCWLCLLCLVYVLISPSSTCCSSVLITILGTALCIMYIPRLSVRTRWLLFCIGFVVLMHSHRMSSAAWIHLGCNIMYEAFFPD